MNFLKGFYGMVMKARLHAKALGIPLTCLPDDWVVPILQTRIRRKKWIVGAGPYSCWLGIFEYEKRVLFEKTIKEGSVVFDIGAHAGFYSLLASELVGCKGRVFAFEPVPRNLRYLKEHLRINHITNVQVIEAAVADVDGRSMFMEHADSSMGRMSADGSLEVRTITLDQLASDGGIPIPQYLKIDVEGSEAAVLSGARQLLVSTHPVIFLSTHGQDLHRKCCGFLTSLGYSLRAVGEKDVKESDELLAVI